MKKKRIAIVGAGISGLICAYELQKDGHEVIVFERESFVGGRMSTRIKESLPFDIGADHLGGAYKEMAKYCRELGLEWEPMINPFYAIYRKGVLYPAYKAVKKLDQIRLAIYAFFLKKKTNFFNLSSVKSDSKGDAYTYTKRILGRESADYLAQGVVNGYQFHDAREISKGVFKAYLQTIKFDHWLLHRIGGGMASLPEKLAETVDIRLNTPIEAVKQGESPSVQYNGIIESFDMVVLSCTADCASKLLQDQTNAQKQLFDAVEYATTISLTYKIDLALAPKETNVFVPLKESSTIASWTNQAMKGNDFIKNDQTLISTWLHESYAKEIFDLSDAEILKRVQVELFNYCPFLSSPDELEPYDLYKWKYAMPKYSEKLIEVVANFLENEQGKNKIYFCGDYLNAPWTEGALRSGQAVARQIISKP